MINKIWKRDGSVEKFDPKKIEKTVHKAFISSRKIDTNSKKITENILAVLDRKFGKKIPTTEDIQNVIEKSLVENRFSDVAKTYILFRQKREQESARIPAEPCLTQNAMTVLERRYLLKDDDGNVIESPNEMFRRVAKTVAAVEKKYGNDAKKKEEEFYAAMSSIDFLPNSPTLMNAGTKLGQLSACFVLPIYDSLESIFSTVHDMALIHQTGGGCIVEGSKVFTSFCGLEDIDVLYEKILQQGYKETNHGTHNTIDISDKNIYTISFDKKSNKFVKDKITKLWKFSDVGENAFTVKTKTGTEIMTSAWHPFIIFDGMLREKRADELKRGDLILKPNVTSEWLFQAYSIDDGIKVDRDLAWLIGYYLGDGSIGQSKNGLRFRLFDGKKDSLQKARKILLERFEINVKIQQDSRRLYSITTTNQKFIKWFLKITGVPIGNKTELYIPELILKSPQNVLKGFFAGLIDSDGYVDNRNSRTSFSGINKTLIEQLSCLFSLFGLQPTIRVRQPKGKAKHVCYELVLSVSEDIERVKEILINDLADATKKARLSRARFNEKTTQERLPIPFFVIEHFLQKIGIKTKSTSIHRKSVEINGKKFCLIRMKTGQGISRLKLLRVLDELDIEEARQLKNIIENITVVEIVEKTPTTKLFYDFTVEKNSNYLSGMHGMTVIHNTGFDFSKLRPKGDIVKSTNGVASGPVSFMRVFDVTSDVIKQGGKRRGASMGVLRMDHPDIIEFIASKTYEDALKNFNISVAVTDEFMEKITKNENYPMINPRTGKSKNSLSARDIFKLIISSAWRTGDPGIIFIDEVNRKNPMPSLGKIEATNPCGEAPLLPYESCNLGSINLSHMVADGRIDWEKLKHITQLGVNFLDNIIDANRLPLRKIDAMTKANRKIGLGVMGFADMLLQLGIPYDSEKALVTGEKIMKFISYEARKASIELAVKRGDFPNFSKSTLCNEYGHMRNATVTTIAPTGTISIIAGCTSGIEPLFAVAFARKVLSTSLLEVNRHFEEAARNGGFYSDKLMSEIAKTGSLKGLSIPADIARIFVTALDIAPEWHVRMQAAFQKYTDQAVSKTVNLPQTSTIADIERVFMLAYKLKCKGITIYRYGSKKEQVLYLGKTVTAEPDYAGGCPTLYCEWA
ncbi:MAG: adenosylcobalamin-dependent ribonucleoside-diphosphate reductase [Candidatus Aenigmarchaeota archaeon]|nr:adenosylcobalamin-dependent ribonucleoside-diphosphate reductase [Candidatus Aenigmarchaeota archaeon]